MLEHQALTVQHTSPRFIRLNGQPTFGYSQSINRPDLYISWLSSRHACRLDSQLEFDDIQ